MKLRKLLLCLVLVLAACGAVNALADAAVEDFWNYAYSVDRSVYINTSDGLGLFMRYGPGTEYSKVNSRTIPNGTTIHISQECTAANGWKWGYCNYTFPGQGYASSGWICLVETTTQAPTAQQAAPAQQTPAQQQAPVQEQTEPVQEAPAQEDPAAEAPAEATEEATEETAAETTTEAETDQAATQQTGETLPAPATYNSMLLVIIGILIGIIAMAAALFIVTRRKR